MTGLTEKGFCLFVLTTRANWEKRRRVIRMPLSRHLVQVVHPEDAAYSSLPIPGHVPFHK